MCRALVTGASGFIGQHLVRALVERGYQVTALVRETSQVDRLESLGVRLAYGDLSDPASLASAVAGHRVVCHLAGCVKASRARHFYRVNALGQKAICRACAEEPDPPALVIVSSLSAVGPSCRGRPRTEGDSAMPVSYYGRSKRAGEMVAERFAHRVPTTIVRPPIVFGEGDPACLQMFRTIQRTGIHFIPGFFPRKYSLVHVADLVELLIRAAERGERLPGRTRWATARPGQGYYFVDCGQQLSYYRLGRMMARALGRRSVILLPFGPLMVRGVSAVADLFARLRGQAAYLSLDKARDAIAGSWVCSAEKASSQLGFSVAVPLQERLCQTADWYRRENWLRQ